MSSIISFLILFVIVSVGAILLMGLVNMSRSGSVRLSQQLMRWRVGMQFVAVCLIMVSFYFNNV